LHATMQHKMLSCLNFLLHFVCGMAATELFCSLVDRLTATSALLVVRRIQIMVMNQYAWWTISFEIQESYYICGPLDGTMLHSEQYGSCVGVCLWFVSSRRQLWAPLAVCSHLISKAQVVLHGAVYLIATCVSVDTDVKYESARKCRRKFRCKFRHEEVLSRNPVHNLVNLEQRDS
jgi:hypothetical protein